jgi:CHAD domain-containing protein
MTEQLLQPGQIPLLERLIENEHSGSVQRRARILLLYNAGKHTREIAGAVGLAPRSVRHWRREFLKRGMDIFSANEEAEPSEPPAEEPGTVKLTNIEPESTTRPFPRVRKNPGVKPDDSMAEAGRKILRFHFAHMLTHEKGTRLGEDIEALHDMRVATRRMRAAFEIFRPFFKPKLVKQHLKGLRATGRALGRVRDVDVFVEKAGHYLRTQPEVVRPGLEPLLVTWQQQRLTEREKMLSHLDSESYNAFKLDFNDFTSTPGAGARANSGSSPRPELVRHVVPVLIYNNLASIRAYQGIITNATLEQLHALRIECKKLRYLLEFFREVLGKGLSAVIDDLKVVQDHLGDLNDANVACHNLREFIDSWEERQVLVPLHERQNPEPVVAYLAAKHAERHKLMAAFPQVWEHFNRPEFLENLALAVSVL